MKTRFLSLPLLIVICFFVLASSCQKPTESDVVSTPVFTPSGGSYAGSQTVSITCATQDVTIRYTLDGSVPNSASPVYTNPISITQTTTIKAKGFKDDWTPSVTATATYTISGGTPAQMILVPAGTFTMGRTNGDGNSSEVPTHSVTLNSFYIGKYEVTQAEYSQYMPPAPTWTSSSGLGENYPVYGVSWYSVLKYCNLRSMAEGLTPAYTILGSTNPANWGGGGVVPTDTWPAWDAVICNWNANGYRMPTEAEWEYAARGATNSPDYLYSGSDDINAVAWCMDNSDLSSQIVGTKTPNGIGTYDMSGNSWEWCWDWYSSSYYSSSPSNNPTGPASEVSRVIRGGTFNYIASSCRVAKRGYSFPYTYGANPGFRLCRPTN